MSSCLHKVTTAQPSWSSGIFVGSLGFLPLVIPCINTYPSMTTLLMHTVAHFTKPSFRPKTNNQPLKKFLSLALS